MPRLVVVSNRVALPDRGAQAGGLAVALNGALARSQGVWFGWSGKVATPGPARTVEHEGITYVTIDLGKADHQEFYNGFANGVLWPILHYRLDLVEFARRDFGGYSRVNDYFAKHLEAILKPDDIVWVHDYHLIPLARSLRERGFKNRIGFFLHIPFPPPEIVTALPNHDRLIPALCHYDLVGFQTDIDAGNFSRYVAQELGLSWASGNSFQYFERTVEFAAFPIGIETNAFAELAKKASETKFVRNVIESLSGRAMIIGVDRLDYSKGLPLRDGMNLVAKEYVAAQDPTDPGVLILSRFAGAARELKAALLVNPYDAEGVGGTIDRALSMPLEERRNRHAELFKILSHNDLAHWSENFLARLACPSAQADLPARFRVV